MPDNFRAPFQRVRSALQRPTSGAATRNLMTGPTPERPADRVDGRYMNFGDVPNPGERPVTPLWERPTSLQDLQDAAGGGSAGSGFTIGGAGTAASATQRGVQDAERVSSQLSKLLSGSSAYMKNARLSGQDFAAQRGLLSGSMAAGNAQKAAIEAGLPIAAQDASWEGRTAADNMDAQNAASIVNANNASQLMGQEMSLNAGQRSDLFRALVQDRQTAQERNFGRERDIFQSEETGRERDFSRENRDFDAWRDQESDFRRADLDESSSESNFRRVMQQRLFDIRGDMVGNTFNTVMQSMVDNPEEWDEYSASGIMQFFSGESSQLFDDLFGSIFGGGSGRPAPTGNMTTQPVPDGGI